MSSIPGPIGNQGSQGPLNAEQKKGVSSLDKLTAETASRILSRKPVDLNLEDIPLSEKKIEPPKERPISLDGSPKKGVQQGLNDRVNELTKGSLTPRDDNKPKD